MDSKRLIAGNEAIAMGAAAAGCTFFTGYPITPQNEIPEWFAKNFPKTGGVFLQSESETGSIQILQGAASTGVRAMTSTSSMGWSLMQEGMSGMVNAEMPCVIVHVQRAGPGGGNIRNAQMDYLSVTRGGGHGGYKNIVLAPTSVQECFDLAQLAFYLADKYRNPVVILSDAITGHIMESVQTKTLEFGPLPEKDWAIKGKGHHPDKKRRGVLIRHGELPEPQRPELTYLSFIQLLDNKFKEITANEQRYEGYDLDDANIVLVAHGSSARTCRKAAEDARSRGFKVGVLQPVTLWPFPVKPFEEKAKQGAKFLVVEDSLGQLVDDVRAAVKWQAEVHLLNMLARHIPTQGGMILPDRVLSEIEKIAG